MNLQWLNTCVVENKKARVGQPKFQLEFCPEIENMEVRVDNPKFKL